jgi:AraC-like DNA-binding protein
MNYQTIEPVGVLKDYVQYFWILKVSKDFIPTFDFQTFADGSSGIIVQQAQGQSGVKRDGNYLPTSFIYGQSTQPTFSVGMAGLFAVGVVFHPHTIHELFEIDAYVLTNNVIPLQDFIPNSKLEQQVFGDTKKALYTLSKFLIEQIGIKGTNVGEIFPNALQLIQHHRGALPVRDILSHYQISERKLQRLFLKTIGVSPRMFLQITRFQHAVKILKTSPNTRIVELSHDLGYSDQAHFIHTVKKFSGFSPRVLKQYLNRQIANAMLTSES